MNRFWTKRWPFALAMMAVLLMGLSGCAGGLQATSWTGVAAKGDRLYAADLEQVAVLSAVSGELLWTFPLDPKEDRVGSFYVTPAVDDEYVIVASQMPPTGFFSQPSNIVWALDAETGLRKWQFDGAAGQYVEGGAIGSGVFVIGNSDGNVYALDAESGAQRWTFKTGHRVWATPLIVSDIVYISSMDRHLYALDLNTGQEHWSFHAGGALTGTPALGDGTLYVGAFDDQFYAIDARTGAERWRFVSENWFWGSPEIQGSTVYAADVNGNVYAINAETGEQIWKRSLDALVRAGPALTEDGTQLFVGSQDGTLYALDTSDGFVKWSRDGEGQVLSTPIVGESTVYEVRIYGASRIRALHVENGREQWVYAPQDEEGK